MTDHLQQITLDQLHVLLVEPSSTQQRIIVNHLNGFGIMVIDTVTTGGAALDTLNPDLHDLIISAMHLQDMTGKELVHDMRRHEHLRDMPFMLISSETHFRYLEPIRQAGVIAILPKPYEIEQLKRALFPTVHYLDPSSLDTEEIAAKDLNVLVVDDSFTAQNHIKRVLSNMGIQRISEAKNGKEAVDIIAEHFFDLIVTDYGMPEMDGKQLVEHIRSHSNQTSIPVLMVSSESDDSRLAALQQAGISATCDKPFETETVRELLQKMLV